MPTRVAAVSFVKNLLHNSGVTAVSFGFALFGKALDAILGLEGLASPLITPFGWLLLAIGIGFRVWAALHFYDRKMDVISLSPQRELVTSGPYAFSRNPLYLGGNLFAFLGTSFILGSPSAVLMTIANITLIDRWMIPREERQLDRTFGTTTTAIATEYVDGFDALCDLVVRVERTQRSASSVDLCSL